MSVDVGSWLLMTPGQCLLMLVLVVDDTRAVSVDVGSWLLMTPGQCLLMLVLVVDDTRAVSVDAGLGCW